MTVQSFIIIKLQFEKKLNCKSKFSNFWYLTILMTLFILKLKFSGAVLKIGEGLAEWLVCGYFVQSLTGV